MLAFDTNLAVYAANSASPEHRKAVLFLDSLSTRTDVVVCELMLVELFLKLCNERIFPNPMKPKEAAAYCDIFRPNQAWGIVENAPVMDEVWKRAARANFSYRRILDVRLALTLIHHGVSEFATHNVKDFHDAGFRRVWDPLD